MWFGAAFLFPRSPIEKCSVWYHSESTGVVQVCGRLSQFRVTQPNVTYGRPRIIGFAGELVNPGESAVAIIIILNCLLSSSRFAALSY